MNQETAKLTKMFEQLIRHKSPAEIFNEFLDFGMLLFKMERTAEQNEWIQKNIKTYLPLFEQLGIACEHLDEEPLGDIFMEYLSYGKNGQFFTPMHICMMMQQMTMGEDKEERRVCDPACGSGRTLLAAGVQNRNLWIYGSDLDLTCVKMTALNMLLHTMRGEVAHMNALSMDHYHSYHIHRVNIGGVYLSTWTESGPGETNFIEQLEKAMEKQEQQPAQFDDKNIHEASVDQVGKNGQLIMF